MDWSQLLLTLIPVAIGALATLLGILLNTRKEVLLRREDNKLKAEIHKEDAKTEMAKLKENNDGELKKMQREFELQQQKDLLSGPLKLKVDQLSALKEAAQKLYACSVNEVSPEEEREALKKFESLAYVAEEHHLSGYFSSMIQQSLGEKPLDRSFSLLAASINGIMETIIGESS